MDPIDAVEQSSSSSTSDVDDNEPYISSPNSTPPPPPSAHEIDFRNRHISLKRFGEDLHAAARAVFPNESRSRYSKITVLMLSWEDEDPNLPVSIEISRLYDVFSKTYGFDVEMWKIPDRNCHFEVNQKIGKFVTPADDNKEHLKIVYYAGHGRLTKNRTLAWTSWRNRNKTGIPSLVWSSIQVLLEQAENDVLILLDCCSSGTANTGEGNGVSELISACGYNSAANGVGLYSFTNALVIELKELSKKPIFSVGELYSNIYRRTQNWMPEDGTERHPPPIHLTLTQEDEFPRSIQLSARRLLEQPTAGSSTDSNVKSTSHPDQNIERGAALSTLARGDSPSTQPDSRLENPGVSACHPKVPRLAFAIRLKDTVQVGELSEDLFKEWLRTIPTFVEEVKVEAGFDSFSSLLIVSLPIPISVYIPQDPAVICLGPITSSNLIPQPTTNDNPKGESAPQATKPRYPPPLSTFYRPPQSNTSKRLSDVPIADTTKAPEYKTIADGSGGKITQPLVSEDQPEQGPRNRNPDGRPPSDSILTSSSSANQAEIKLKQFTAPEDEPPLILRGSKVKRELLHQVRSYGDKRYERPSGPTESSINTLGPVDTVPATTSAANVCCIKTPAGENVSVAALFDTGSDNSWISMKMAKKYGFALVPIASRDLKVYRTAGIVKFSPTNYIEVEVKDEEDLSHKFTKVRLNVSPLLDDGGALPLGQNCGHEVVFGSNAINKIPVDIVKWETYNIFKVKEPPAPAPTAKYLESPPDIDPLSYRKAQTRGQGGSGGSDNKSSLSAEAAAKTFEIGDRISKLHNPKLLVLPKMRTSPQGDGLFDILEQLDPI